jgi:hypothetical protein
MPRYLLHYSHAAFTGVRFDEPYGILGYLIDIAGCALRFAAPNEIVYATDNAPGALGLGSQFT